MYCVLSGDILKIQTLSLGALGALSALAATVAEAAPIFVGVTGNLVQTPQPPGTTPADFAAPIDNGAVFSAYWILDPDGATEVRTPLGPPATGQLVNFLGSVREFGAYITGPTQAPVGLGLSARSTRSSFLINDSFFAPSPGFPSGRYADQFSISSGPFFDAGGMVQQLTVDRSLGEGVFISMFSFNFLDSLAGPGRPDMLDDESFPNFGRLIALADTSFVSLRFARGAPTSSAELRLLPLMQYQVNRPNVVYFDLPDVGVPEPAGIGLFGLGLAAFALRRRKAA